MGQQSSANGACCTSRGDDEARPSESSLKHATSPGKEPKGNSPAVGTPRLVAEDCAREVNSDGGTGGTGSGAARESSLCDGEGFIDLGCVPDRGADVAAGRRMVFGEKSLKPRLQRQRTCEAEVEALLQTRTQISKRVPEDGGKGIAVPAVLQTDENHIDQAELVRRLCLHEESLAGVPESFVSQACEKVLSKFFDGKPVAGERAVELSDMKIHYVDILTTIDTLVQQRISQLHNELAKIDAEVGQIEDLIALCFDKMDEDGEGHIGSGSFVAFVCDHGDSTEGTQQGIIVVSPEDAESLFMTMSHGQGELTFEQFKDEITSGCLEVMQSNMVIRSLIQKRYRDCGI